VANEEAARGKREPHIILQKIIKYG